MSIVQATPQPRPNWRPTSLVRFEPGTVCAAGGRRRLRATGRRPESSACRCPTAFSDVGAASLPGPSSPSGQRVRSRRLQPGETLLVQGGTSGIGVTAIQLSKAMVRGDRHRRQRRRQVRRLRGAGADHAINHRTADFAAEVLSLTGRAASTSSSTCGGGRLRRTQSLPGRRRPPGDHRGAGAARGQDRRRPVLRRRLTITGSTLRPRSVAFKTRMAGLLRATSDPDSRPAA